MQNSTPFGEIQTSNVTFIAHLMRFRLISHPFKNPPKNSHRPMGIHHSPHTHPIPIPLGIPMGISIPTAALVKSETDVAPVVVGLPSERVRRPGSLGPTSDD